MNRNETKFFVANPNNSGDTGIISDEMEYSGSGLVIEMDFRMDPPTSGKDDVVALLGGKETTEWLHDTTPTILKIVGSASGNLVLGGLKVNGEAVDADKIKIATNSYQEFYAAQNNSGRSTTGWLHLTAKPNFITQQVQVILTRKSTSEEIFNQTVDFAGKVESFKYIFGSQGKQYGNLSIDNISVTRDETAAKTNLDAIIAQAEGILSNGKKYTAETLAAMQTALDNAKKLDADAGMEALDASASALYAAIEGLVEDNVTVETIAALANGKATSDAWAEYQHPDKVTATLYNKESLELSISEDGWSCQEFNAETAVSGYYTWTANAQVPQENQNDQYGATVEVSYVVEYKKVPAGNHDYENDFTFPEDSKFDLYCSVKKDGAGGYLEFNGSGSGHRSGKLSTGVEEMKAVEVSFDWLVDTCTNGTGNIRFLGSDGTPYFTICADKAYAISCFPDTQTATNTGLSGKNKWYGVNLKFDYSGHTAELTITPKDSTDASASYTETFQINENVETLGTFELYGNRDDKMVMT